jgi:hypothetical protein
MAADLGQLMNAEMAAELDAGKTQVGRARQAALELATWSHVCCDIVFTMSSVKNLNRYGISTDCAGPDVIAAVQPDVFAESIADELERLTKLFNVLLEALSTRAWSASYWTHRMPHCFAIALHDDYTTAQNGLTAVRSMWQAILKAG